MIDTGIGLAEIVRLGLLLGWRWALGSPRGEDAIQRTARRVGQLEGRWSILGRGYWLVTAAERRADQ
jgi:hypothetical protein